jgi:hypothetical protein
MRVVRTPRDIHDHRGSHMTEPEKADRGRFVMRFSWSGLRVARELSDVALALATPLLRLYRRALD